MGELNMYQANSYKNVMEILIDEEIDRQTGHYSQEQAQSINRIEVATYALNRVPPLYASSQEGIGLQYQRGQAEFSEPIRASVRQALILVHKKPNRTSTPFPRFEEEFAAQHLATNQRELQELSVLF
jgi:hypothetical protein